MIHPENNLCIHFTDRKHPGHTAEFDFSDFHNTRLSELGTEYLKSKYAEGVSLEYLYVNATSFRRYDEFLLLSGIVDPLAVTDELLDAYEAFLSTKIIPKTGQPFTEKYIRFLLTGPRKIIKTCTSNAHAEDL